MYALLRGVFDKFISQANSVRIARHPLLFFCSKCRERIFGSNLDDMPRLRKSTKSVLVRRHSSDVDMARLNAETTRAFLHPDQLYMPTSNVCEGLSQMSESDLRRWKTIPCLALDCFPTKNTRIDREFRPMSAEGEMLKTIHHNVATLGADPGMPDPPPFQSLTASTPPRDRDPAIISPHDLMKLSPYMSIHHLLQLGWWDNEEEQTPFVSNGNNPTFALPNFSDVNVSQIYDNVIQYDGSLILIDKSVMAVVQRSLFLNQHLFVFLQLLIDVKPLYARALLSILAVLIRYCENPFAFNQGEGSQSLRYEKCMSTRTYNGMTIGAIPIRLPSTNSQIYNHEQNIIHAPLLGQQALCHEDHIYANMQSIITLITQWLTGDRSYRQNVVPSALAIQSHLYDHPVNTTRAVHSFFLCSPHSLERVHKMQRQEGIMTPIGVVLMDPLLSNQPLSVNNTTLVPVF